MCVSDAVPFVPMVEGAKKEMSIKPVVSRISPKFARRLRKRDAELTRVCQERDEQKSQVALLQEKLKIDQDDLAKAIDTIRENCGCDECAHKDSCNVAYYLEDCPGWKWRCEV